LKVIGWYVCLDRERSGGGMARLRSVVFLGERKPEAETDLAGSRLAL
jgi:hypothetical protein